MLYLTSNNASVKFSFLHHGASLYVFVRHSIALTIDV